MNQNQLTEHELKTNTQEVSQEAPLADLVEAIFQSQESALSAKIYGKPSSVGCQKMSFDTPGNSEPLIKKSQPCEQLSEQQLATSQPAREQKFSAVKSRETTQQEAPDLKDSPNLTVEGQVELGTESEVASKEDRKKTKANVVDDRIQAEEGGAPKRPLSPFIFYSQEARRLIKLNNPQLHSKQIMKQVQKNWKEMSEEQKELYKVQSKINRSQYDEKRRVFDDHRMRDSELGKFIVIEAIQERRAEREAKQLDKQDQEIYRSQRQEQERIKTAKAKIQQRYRLKIQKKAKLQQKKQQKENARLQAKIQKKLTKKEREQQLDLQKKAIGQQDPAFPVKRSRGRPRKILTQPQLIIQEEKPIDKIRLAEEVNKEDTHQLEIAKEEQEEEKKKEGTQAINIVTQSPQENQEQQRSLRKRVRPPKLTPFAQLRDQDTRTPTPGKQVIQQSLISQGNFHSLFIDQNQQQDQSRNPFVQPSNLVQLQQQIGGQQRMGLARTPVTHPVTLTIPNHFRPINLGTFNQNQPSIATWTPQNSGVFFQKPVYFTNMSNMQKQGSDSLIQLSFPNGWSPLPQRPIPTMVNPSLTYGQLLKMSRSSHGPQVSSNMMNPLVTNGNQVAQGVNNNFFFGKPQEPQVNPLICNQSQTSNQLLLKQQPVFSQAQIRSINGAPMEQLIQSPDIQIQEFMTLANTIQPQLPTQLQTSFGIQQSGLEGNRPLIQGSSAIVEENSSSHQGQVSNIGSPSPLTFQHPNLLQQRMSSSQYGGITDQSKSATIFSPNGTFFRQSPVKQNIPSASLYGEQNGDKPCNTSNNNVASIPENCNLRSDANITEQHLIEQQMPSYTFQQIPMMHPYERQK